MRNIVLGLVMALATHQSDAKRDDMSRYATMLESLLEKQTATEANADMPAQKKVVHPHQHSDVDEPPHPEVKREGRPADHQPVSGEHRTAPGKLGKDPGSYNYREMVQKDKHKDHRMSSPENDESMPHPAGFSMDPHQPHDKYDHLMDQVGMDT